MDSDRVQSRTLDDIPRSHQRRRVHEDQAAYSDDSSHQFGSLQSSPMGGYQSDYSPQTGHRQQQSFPPYTSTMMYSLPQSPSVAAHSYNTIQSYPTHRQNAAIEVLSSQFGIPPYYVSEPHGSSSNVGTPHQQPQSQYYPQSSSPQRLPQSYTSSIHELTQQPPISSAISSTADTENSQQSQGRAFEEDYSRYQTALRGTFQHMRDGRLLEAGNSLLELSTWLLTNAVDLGLVRDEQELYADRTRLWNEFNICWLSVLAKEKELIQNIMAGQQLQSPKGILREEALQHLGSELIRLCDSMERHGLVDYQMGVWEEEILDSIQECLDLLERHYGSPPVSRSS